MINAKPISQNVDRYNIGNDQWVVSASPDIQPLTFQFGTPNRELKPVIEADGVIIDVGLALLCSKRTLKMIEARTNPHYDVSVNGEVKVKNRMVKIGNTIPIIKINVDKLPPIGTGRKVFNSKAGVDSATYTYQGEEVMGVPKGLIDQLNYTLVEEFNRPGDTFSYWKWVTNSNSNYGLGQLNVDTAQEDGKLDKKKLETFVKTVGERLELLRADFKSLTRTFFWGETPTATGIQLTNVKNYILSPEDDIIQHQYVEKVTKVVGHVDAPTQKTVTATANAASEASKPKPPEGPVIENWWFKYYHGRTSTFGGAISNPNMPGTKTTWYSGTLWKVDPSTEKYPAKIKNMYEGEAFWGHKVKDWKERPGDEIWKVYESDRKTFKGWMNIQVAGRFIKPVAVPK